MACAHNVVVKNTFINVLDNDNFENEPCKMNGRARTLSDPLPQLASEEPDMQRFEDNPKETGLDATAIALESPRTSVGYEDSDDTPFSQEEWSSIGTPVLSPRVEMVASATMACSDTATRFMNKPRLDELIAPKQLDIPSEWHGKTSVMVRNISYKCSRSMFCEALDKAGYKNMFDYVYVPINAGRGTSKGYAFANFVDDRTAYRFKQQFDGRKMDVPGAFKLLEIIPANLQGYSQNASHYITKQSELSTVPRNDFDQSSHTNADCTHVVRSKSPEEESKSSTCHQCQRQVLCRARFCQWCGSGL
eukprot:TRINITY_DN1887_c0_g2_i1.p1 TRINITY_DN1887_c0_g2~~TRINITY_DN1887_c0_g2_i1.p1  ORF type:complete len:305 (-),score=29.60 TRINITY_DN1887_c0_g2_i1:521-1435(-)